MCINLRPCRVSQFFSLEDITYMKIILLCILLNQTFQNENLECHHFK